MAEIKPYAPAETDGRRPEVAEPCARVERFCLGPAAGVLISNAPPDRSFSTGDRLCKFEGRPGTGLMRFATACARQVVSTQRRNGVSVKTRRQYRHGPWARHITQPHQLCVSSQHARSHADQARRSRGAKCTWMCAILGLSRSARGTSHLPGFSAACHRRRFGPWL